MVRVALIGIAAALLLAGCGQKGPLYLPDKKGAAVTPAPAATPPAAAAPGAAQPGTTTPGKSDKDQDTPQPPQ